MIPISTESAGASHHSGQETACGGCGDSAQLDIEFEYAYQPIVDFNTRSIYAYEALVRGPEGESAASVLAQVNDNNRYRFDQACRMKAVEGASRLGMRELLSINFLPNAVYRPEVCIRSTFEAARKHNFPIENIIFEVTEGERVQDRPHLVNIFREYRRFGFQTAIDDFGAGYAGLNLLAEYQPNLVKIDMDLVRNVDQSRPRQAIVAGIAAICRDLDIRVLAEGIETRAERDFLLRAGISLMQGYWFAKPAFKSLAVIVDAAWE
ncbi:EAL domain-containing protein (putative c-di-GMP-specific phosphodiesterase class I) [Herbaspirillum sp. Sphag1AN]|uniref:EAL domain-containing protein n=1 Tax=unclassified Herbaspirillum TaxID=2624150 RepID=UPI0016076416|nr:MULTISPECIES: EAL domain-containing protein [unclassified Herbaspirillum]MBB3212484.1 EAL domain-containing protein (putative c-di-GMP-specific phosphodiesterase class I) [Herbaspirillum sp. Sphag1AN]MBB3245417.1 EAL domain-containing protein (putative c-di-GMP-specific phosphodiesterase class I) [Herbaspirillum sp. Sphag64]